MAIHNECARQDHTKLQTFARRLHDVSITLVHGVVLKRI